MLTWLQESSTMFVSSRTQRRALLHVEARGRLYQIKGVLSLIRVGGTQNKINIISIFSAIISPPELIQAPL